MSLLPNLPSETSIVPYVRSWAITKNKIDQIAQAISGNANPFNIGLWFNDPSQALISIRKYPFNVVKQLHDSVISYYPVMIGGFDSQVAGVRIGDHDDDLLKFIDFGKITMLRHFNDFRDFEPYTRAYLYVPFFGWSQIPIAELYKGPDIELKMAVDIATGFANIYLISVDSLSTYHVVAQQGKKLGCDVPICLNNSGENQRELLGNIMMGGIATAVAPTGFTNLALLGIASQSADNYKLQHTQSGSFGSFASFYDPNYAFIKIERVPDDPQLSSSVVGRSLNQIKTLSTLSGFTQVSNVNVSLTDQMTRTEADEIESLLNQGVIL